ncbi:hypothetical protein BaRGS_00013278 [Batillaria attramentaria]|uniref:Uncharacterized protein n=1 Tax=Batillaria attramentaria TaxID=370345 RepID=A0ABD0L8S0_9CAEN
MTNKQANKPYIVHNAMQSKTVEPFVYYDRQFLLLFLNISKHPGHAPKTVNSPSSIPVYSPPPPTPDHPDPRGRRGDR